MKVLVLNSGSSSIKCKFFVDHERYFSAIIDGIGLELCTFRSNYNYQDIKEKCNVLTHSEALKLILDKLLHAGFVDNLDEIDAIGHRVVHGGELYHDSVLIDDEVMNNIDYLSEFAPLHNPHNLSGIKACHDLLPNRPQIAVFDTSFHAKIPKKNYMYAIPNYYYNENKIRKYGFHGTSFKYITEQVKKHFKDIEKLIICHIGNGSSVCAVEREVCVDTSMGFTPLQGLIMGTRSGDIDPSIVEFLSELEEKKYNRKFSVQEIIEILNKKSGLKGITGKSDMREIWNDVLKKDNSEECEKAKLAIDMLVNSLLKYISYYITQLQGVDAIVFTAGIGENAYYLREKVIKQLNFLGIKLDFDRNKENGKNSDHKITTDDSKIKVLVIPTNEELMISKEVERIVLK